MLKSWKMPKEAGGFTLTGRSRAADATCLCIPELEFLLDCGAIVHQNRPTHVFISHTHSDHANRLTHTVSRTRPPTWYIPENAVAYVDSYINAHQAMTNNSTVEEVEEAMAKGPPDWLDNRHSVGVKGGDSIQITKQGRNLTVEVVNTDHSVHSAGYCFSESKRKLKEEYKGLPGREIGELRKKGVEINDNVHVPLFAYLGDTTPRVFEDYPQLLKFPVIITECTFLDEAERANADRTKHTLWHDLKPYVQNNPQVTFVLIHFSLRYKEKEVNEFFTQLALDPNEPIKNVVYWVPEKEDNNQLHQPSKSELYVDL